MIRVRWWALTVIAAGVGVVSYLATLLLLERGYSPWYISPVVALVLVIIGVLITVWGWQVRALQLGKATSMSPLKAIRVLLIAQSAAILGAVVAGLTLAQLLACVGYYEAAYIVDLAWGLSACAGAGLVLVVAGLVTQHWCTIDSDDEDGDSPSSHRPSGPLAHPA